MGCVLVRCGSRLISVNLDENNVSGIGTIAQHIESYDARLVSTGNRVLLRSGKEGIKLVRHDRNVDMNKKEAVRHELTLFDDQPERPSRLLKAPSLLLQEVAGRSW
jgi:predicted RNA-binding protein with PUA domain